MPDDPLETTPPAAATAPARESNRKTKCVFCECVMTVDGIDIYHMGDKAKSFQKLQEVIDKKDQEIARTNEELRTVKAERDALKAQVAGTSRGSHVGSLVTRRSE